MYYRVTRLKRYKVLRIVLNIISLPIRLPMFLLYIISEKMAKITEDALDICNGFLYCIMKNLVKFFKFEEIADKQYENNKDKFKRR